ncbi:Gfo/Idh/MocA family protein [Selenomonas ruminantium]|uniref:Predicted dehydrogenase n=1 Tax=Selenomonas ruminantium TaxID=971 RepID=A0A1H0U778_SELRU|nr:Gfo/Idh/MocA family oxidoreductase [Selenomonas ruminantium]SDP62019.1 Predicted dehydrogenase [Selenomonas ruminantium]
MKLAILGTGFIVKEGALPALREVPEIEVTAIFAREKSKGVADKLAVQYDIPKVYTDYDELLASQDVEFVYIGLTNSVHYEYAKKALLAGKHVIMEKPFASTAAEVRELVELALAKHLYIFEAVTLLHLPNFHAIKEKLAELGKITAVMANYSQYSSRYDRYLKGEVLPAFDPELSGGALYDINIYNLNFIIGLFGAPNDVSYTPNIGFNGIDTSGTLLLKYKDFTATALGAKDSESPCFITIQGEKGWLKVLGAPNALAAFEVSIHGSRAVTRYELNRYAHRMVHEFKEFAALYAAQDYAAMEAGLKVSQTVLETAEQARKDAGIVFGCDRQ